jgi:hypothetical protein
VFARFTGAAARGFLVAIMVATPSMLLPAHTSPAPEIVVLLAILAAALTFAEYNSSFPSYIEFRDAPPLNRMRFLALFAMVLLLALIARHRFDPSNLTALVAGLGALIGGGIDFPYSPVRLVILMLPADAASVTVDAVRAAAGVAYAIALVTVGGFLFSVRVMGWPTGNGAFNVWVNLPLFDPTAGGDVVNRLHRDGRINVILGVLLPFVIPAVIKAASQLVGPVPLANPQTMVWIVAAWAFLPASMVMRGIAMMRIAELIEAKRRRSYATAETMQVA